MALWLASLVFIIGTYALIEGVEHMLEALSKAAIVLGVAPFILAVLLAGFDLENLAIGVAALIGDIPAAGVGTVPGAAIFILTLTLGLGGIIVPFQVKVDRMYLWVTLGAIALSGGLLLAGALGLWQSLVLVVAYAVFAVTAVRRERRRLQTDDTSVVFRDEDIDEVIEDEHPRWYWPVTAVVSMLVMAAGAQMMVVGARTILSTLQWSQTVFGTTVIAAVSSLEEILLTVEPVRKGMPTIAAGNVLGSVIFFVTFNLGMLGLIEPLRALVIDPSMTALHWPFLLASAALASAVLFRGKVTRPAGAMLILVYLVYWGLNWGLA